MAWGRSLMQIAQVVSRTMKLQSGEESCLPGGATNKIYGIPFEGSGRILSTLGETRKFCTKYIKCGVLKLHSRGAESVN